MDWVEGAAWNATVTKRLGDLLKVARERTRRKHGNAARVDVLGYVCEAQQRGVFHPHLVLGYRTAADRAALDTFRGTLRRKRGAYGFGTGRRGSFDAGSAGSIQRRAMLRATSASICARTGQRHHSCRCWRRSTG